MKINTLSKSAAVVVFLLTATLFAHSQVSQPLIKRTSTKTDSFNFGGGGTLSITGAPNGSIRVVGTNKNEIEISAEFEMQAANEADLATLASVTGFFTEESNLRTGIVSFGTHNKLGDKKMWKKFPKKLVGLPFRIDYVVRVPRYCDLEIDGGKGDLTISGVEGAMRINFLETNAKIEVITGSTTATITSGTVDVAFGVNGWRGRSADIQLASGELTVRLPSNISAEIDATILRNGVIENLLTDLKPRDRKVVFTERSIIAKAGAGGVPLKFTVGDGTLKMKPLVRPL